MDRKERDKRIDELERKAKDEYTDCIDWREVILMLPKDEQNEYYKLQTINSKEDNL